MASALFRFIGAAGRTMGVANTFGTFVLLLQFALGGFVLSRGIFGDLCVSRSFNLAKTNYC